MAHTIASYDHEDTSLVAIIAMLIAIVLIVGFALFALSAFPFAPSPSSTTPAEDLNINVRGDLEPSGPVSPAPPPATTY